jgi:hypothetical protein
MIYTKLPYLADEQHFDKLRELGITITKTDFPNNLDFTDLPPRYGNEQEEHSALKKLGNKMLDELGGFDADFENNNMDVYSRALQIEIECGNTAIQKVCDLLFNDPYSESITEVWCIYTIGNKKIEIYKFIKPSQ